MMAAAEPGTIVLVANAATTLTLAVAIFQLIRDSRRGQQQRRLEAYNALNDQYIALLRRAAEEPTVDCFDEPLKTARKPKGAAARRRERAAFLEVIALLERAYVFYHRFLTPQDVAYRNQWLGWAAYARNFIKRKRFLATWRRFKHEFDSDFVAWLDGIGMSAASR